MAAEHLPGFRFYPTEEELISFYLANKLQGGSGDRHITQELNKLIPVVDIYSNEPWDLPQFCGEICHRETEQWFFFTPQQERESRGGRTSRTTSSGYWKATGSPSVVYSSTHKKAIGVKKTMVFYEGKAPLGRKTKWKMNEYKTIKEEASPAAAVVGTSVAATASSGIAPVSAGVPELRHEMSLCRVYVTSRDARAFDRRPPPTMISSNNIMTAGSASGSIQEDKDHGQVETAGPSVKRERSCSMERFYSGGPGDLHQHSDHGDGNNEYNDSGTEMMDSLESLWDWEQLNWADYGSSIWRQTKL